MSEQPAPAAARNDRKTHTGVVIRDKMDKTIAVEVQRLVRHPRYDKFLRRRSRLYAHDANDEAKVGDVVEVMETRPMSKLKRWRLVRIVRKAVQ